jgi:aspartate aminotransferase
MIVNSPNNPTGAVYNRQTWEMIAELIVPNDIYLLCDDVYDRIVYPPVKGYYPVRLHPDLRDRVLIANGLSKSMAMTGWRIGWAAGPEEIIDAAAAVQSHVTNHPSSISQKAALAALRGSNEFISAQLGPLKQKRDTALRMLEPLCDGMSPVAQGAFYLFICVDHLLTASDGKPCDSAELALGLLTEKGIAVVPGSAFGMEGYIRLSYSTDMATLVAGLGRLISGLEQLR